MKNITQHNIGPNEKREILPIAIQAQATLEAVFTAFETDGTGLTHSEAGRRLERYGANEVAQDKPVPAVLQLLQAFQNPFIYVLIVLAAISFITDYWLPAQAGDETELATTAIILGMVSLSGVLRFWQEYRSSRAADALKAMVRSTATVIRKVDANGEAVPTEVPMQEVVPGDLVMLSAGDMIPADIRLLESRDLFISQAALTGESIPVEKYDTLGAVCEKSANPTKQEKGSSALLDSDSVCFMGTNVVSGQAKGLVIGTGEETYFGSLAKSITGTRAQTAFDRGVNSVSALLIRFMLIMVPVVFVINGMSKGDWAEAFLFAVAVAVGLTPEMLPMIVSANLAKGALSMSQRKVVVKRLNAIQNFGAMDVLCTDKTGTLTQDKIILERHMDVEGQEDQSVLQMAWLNSFHQSGLRNLMDQAIVSFAGKRNAAAAMAGYKKVDELPFDFIRRRLSVVVEDTEGNHVLICKGAVEEMLAIADTVESHDMLYEYDDSWKKNLQSLARKQNEDGFRVLLLGYKVIGSKEVKEQYTVADEAGMVIKGLLTFLDPPKESAEPAIRALHDHGVTVKILTGDNDVVTTRVCHEVGLEPGRALLGVSIESLSDVELAQEVEKRVVFAKLTPLQKSRVLKALQSNGHTVGFLGDGINDAPALRDADVGISVDSGTDIAKESADIILLEKNLMVLEEGVLKGRETFGNIVKYLNMTASSNFGNVFSVLVASAFIPFLPMLAIHLLVQNLLYDISQMALPWDTVDKEFLAKPRKWDAPNIGRFMIWVGPTSSVFDITTYALMWFVFGASTPELQGIFQSGWFIEGLLSQTLVVHMLRTRKIPFIQSTAAFPVLVMTSLVMLLGVYIPFSPFGALIGLEPLPWSYFPWLLATLVSYCILAQTVKKIYVRKFGRWF